MEIMSSYANIRLPTESRSGKHQLWIDIEPVVSGYGASLRWIDGDGVLVLARHSGKHECRNFIVAVPGQGWLASLADEGYVIDGVIERNADGAMVLAPYVRPVEE